MRSKEMRGKLMVGTPTKETSTLVTIEIVKINVDEDESTSTNSDDKNDEEKLVKSTIR